MRPTLHLRRFGCPPKQLHIGKLALSARPTPYQRNVYSTNFKAGKAKPTRKEAEDFSTPSHMSHSQAENEAARSRAGSTTSNNSVDRLSQLQSHIRTPSTTPPPSRSSSMADQTVNLTPSSPDKPTVAILGTGWAGWTLAQELGTSKSFLKDHRVVVLSPTRTMALTPLLASAACSIFDFRISEEPVRRMGWAEGITKLQVWVEGVDFETKKLTCRPAVGRNGNETAAQDLGAQDAFEVEFEKLIIAPGAETNTFGTPGVQEHCYMMKNVSDAMALRERILDCFELASLPVFDEQKKREILHFVIVGGGPTGVELAAEVDELVHEHLSHVYKELRGLSSISVYDVADRMLGSFGQKLSQYAFDRFEKRNVNICLGKHIEGFDRGVMKVKEDGEVKFGLACWATGNKMSQFVEGLEVMKEEKAKRILTDRWLRVFEGENEKAKEVMDGVYALGDAADVEGATLPTTAEVAVQKAKWLASHLIAGEKKDAKPFSYKQKAMVAYIGREDGVVEGKQDWTGASAWIAWRSGSLQWTRSWRRRAMIVLYWFMNKLDGREVARR